MSVNCSPLKAYNPHSSRKARQKHKLLKRYLRVAAAFATIPATPVQVAYRLKIPLSDMRVIIKELLEANVLGVSHIRPEGIYFTQIP